jgi:hypothetical protein
MKRVLLLISLLVAVGLLALAIRHGLKVQQKRKREGAYQSALLSYMQVLKPRMTRKEVEDYLRARNVDFGQNCCVVGIQPHPKHSLDDITKVGERRALLGSAVNIMSSWLSNLRTMASTNRFWGQMIRTS